ncbi:DUF2834 domain-containing protein [Oceanomicrobium pacificus]|uniref:DUF2834 domain-containing protein n=1 Tax=Oceanomicrobium pacificus TaxID=2692916 RepID=UPI002E29EA47|nr:DUF2834 domain-containing protein [Oceanomicrobium pacificus]
MTRSPLRLTYLALAIIGAVVPMRYFLRWFLENGWSLSGMVEAWHANDATSGLTYDLTIAAVALTLFVIVECIAKRDYLPLVAIPATYCIGVSCGLPLYLYLRSRPL